MIPKILHHVHLGGALQPEAMLCIESAWKHHPDWKHYLWTESTLHELGLEPWVWEHSTYAGSSNIIRLHALHKMGGVYLDTDLEILRPIDSLLWLEAFYARQLDGVPCNAVLGAREGNPFIGWLIDNYGDPRVKDAAWGCHLMEKAPKDHVTEIPTELFYSWNWDAPENEKVVQPDAMGIHHWKASWVKK